MNATIKKEDQVDSGIKEQILEQVPTPVMAVNTDFEMIYMNAAGCDFLGKSWEAVRGFHCYELFTQNIAKHRNVECMRA